MTRGRLNGRDASRRRVPDRRVVYLPEICHVSSGLRIPLREAGTLAHVRERNNHITTRWLEDVGLPAFQNG
jgi:hypothetical protein